MSRRVVRRARPTRRFLKKRTVIRRGPKPETKYVAKEVATITIPNQSDSFDSTLSGTEYNAISIFPNQGTGQAQRIGNSIENVKMWVQIKLLLQPSSQFIPCCEYRIIVFSLNWHGSTPATGNVTNFFKYTHATCPSPIQNSVNRDLVTVKYDRVHKLKAFSVGDYQGTQINNKEYDVRNISLNFRLGHCTFNGLDDILPKQSSKQLYVAAIGKTGSASGNLGYAQTFVKTYYQDN